jgi:hypothetical protein
LLSSLPADRRLPPADVPLIASFDQELKIESLDSMNVALDCDMVVSRVFRTFGLG